MPAITTSHDIRSDIQTQGYSLVTADNLSLNADMQSAMRDMLMDYQDLPPDEYLPGNMTYRFRRYDRFYFNPKTEDFNLLPHQDYFQPEEINQVTGGIVRKFAPLTPTMLGNPFLHALIDFDFANFPLPDAAMMHNPWQVDVHQMLVIAEPAQTASPTPEGIHRDGAEFVTVHLMLLENADGGRVSIYDDDRQHLASFKLTQVLDSYLFNDAILWHGVEPIDSADGINPARRGILTFDYHYKPALTPDG